MEEAGQLFIGTAGWTVPSRYAADFKTAGSHLQRYASRFNAVEINSSFHRSHRRATYERWARTVPARFRFAVKIPKVITHEQRLAACDATLAQFLQEVGGLGAKLGVLLVQLPPSLQFDATVAAVFFASLKALLASGKPQPDTSMDPSIVCEPRHVSWFSGEAEALLAEHRVARVAADPQCAPGGGEPGSWDGLAYFRLHGSPRIYYSNYEREALEALRYRLHKSCSSGIATWCIFDNTAAQGATGNALTLAG